MGNFRVRTHFVFLVYLCTNKERVGSVRFFLVFKVLFVFQRNGRG